MSLLLKRCWYCKREGRFGFRTATYPSGSPVCKNDPACFARAAIRFDEMLYGRHK